MARVTVVGAGMGGLAVAARLATGGHEVTVLERSSDVGGKAGLETWSLGPGTFAFDTGPSLLTMPRVFRDLFAETGEPLDEVVELEQHDPIAEYRFPDGTRFRLPGERDPGGLAEALGDRAVRDWAALQARAARMWRASEGPFLLSPVNGVGSIAAMGRQPWDLPTVAPWQTLRGLGSRMLRDEHLRMCLDRYATYTGSDPRRAPAVLATIPHVEQRFGGWYVRGGIRRLVDATAHRARTSGAVVRTRTDVTRVGVVGGAVDHVLATDLDTGQETLVAADVVVANCDAGLLYRELLARHEPGVARVRRRIGRATPSLSGFVLLLALRGLTPGLGHHTILFPPDQRTYDEEFDAVFGGNGPARPVEQPTVYVTSPADPAVRPDGHEAWFVLVNAPRHGPGAPTEPDTVNWDAAGTGERYAQHVLGLLAERGLDVGSRLLRMSHLTPADLQRRTGAPGGAIYGTSSNGWQASFLRPANTSPVSGLFLVGGSSHPGGGLPLSALSAQITAGLVGPA